jgi:hypothetical protein
LSINLQSRVKSQEKERGREGEERKRGREREKQQRTLLNSEQLKESVMQTVFIVLLEVG